MDSEIYIQEPGYKHSVLRPGEYKIALLQPASNVHDPVVYELVSSDHFTGTYETISYTLGNADSDLCQVIISEGTNHFKHHIPENLHEALRTLRPRDSIRAV